MSRSRLAILEWGRSVPFCRMITGWNVFGGVFVHHLLSMLSRMRQARLHETRRYRSQCFAIDRSLTADLIGTSWSFCSYVQAMPGYAINDRGVVHGIPVYLVMSGQVVGKGEDTGQSAEATRRLLPAS